jgi:hypothetical protein
MEEARLMAEGGAARADAVVTATDTMPILKFSVTTFLLLR